MTNTINFEEIKSKLIERLTPSGWAVKLRGFLLSDDFNKVLETLYTLREQGKRFTPPLKQVFRAFEECPIDKLKVVMIGQDPYPQFGVADGIAFSCSLTGKVQPSLRHIFQAIETTVHQDFPSHQDPDLKRWSNQGVLMLNSALTCEIDKIGSHINVWKDFIAYTIDILNFTNSGLIFVLMGKQSQELENLIDDQHHVIKVSHPASAAYKGGKWECNDLFNVINKIIIDANGKEYKIDW